MYTIEKPILHKLEIKKSIFIAKVYPVGSLDEIQEIFEKQKKEYKDATHLCYGYKLGLHEKCSDNGEPSGTAGLPILHILKQNQLDFILCIVIRYFGGIKLGAGGLIRAYSKSTKEALMNVPLKELTEGKQIQIEFPYTNEKEIAYILKKARIIKKEFLEKVHYTFHITNEDFSLTKESIASLSTILEEKEIIMKKET